MGIRDLIKKTKELSAANASSGAREDAARSLDNSPEFKIVRTDTHTREELHLPDFGDAPTPAKPGDSNSFLGVSDGRPSRRSLDVHWTSRSRSGSASSAMSSSSTSRRRLSDILHISRQPESSVFVPENMPSITASADKESAEPQWEARAIWLAHQSELAMGSSPDSPNLARPRSPSASSKTIDQDVSEAIRLHEEEQFEASTAILGRLAQPNGTNNALSQILYGMALRHGWGCVTNPELGTKYLTLAASNAAAVERQALEAGAKNGGAAKGELILAIYELGTSLRHGLGVKKDEFAARQYYETAANLGDREAMSETGWCYEQGFGCEKSRHAAAYYYRRAHKAGLEMVGQSWIWKEKYVKDDEGEKGDKRKK